MFSGGSFDHSVGSLPAFHWVCFIDGRKAPPAAPCPREAEQGCSDHLGWRAHSLVGSRETVGCRGNRRVLTALPCTPSIKIICFVSSSRHVHATCDSCDRARRASPSSTSVRKVHRLLRVAVTSVWFSTLSSKSLQQVICLLYPPCVHACAWVFCFAAQLFCVVPSRRFRRLT